MDKKTDRLIRLVKQAQEQYSDEYLVIAVPGFISKKFIAYCAMKQDLELIIQYINELRANHTGIIKSALSYSLISLYGKCFTDASKNSFPKLEPSNLFSEGEDNYETHKYLMNLRHQFIAHRGDRENEIGISYMLIPKEGSLDNSQVRFSQIKMAGFSVEELDRIEGLLSYLIEKLWEKIQKSSQKVYDGVLSLFNPEQLSLMLMNAAK
ncbi:hypothetical protein GCM10028807_60230 [Spirosoma daeguense]